MLHPLISHSPDLNKLWQEGLSLEIREGHLLVHEVPYLSDKESIKFGTLICVASQSGGISIKPNDHTCRFQGEAPCDIEGKKLVGVINSERSEELIRGFKSNFLFSAKPKRGYYIDFYEKITQYVALLSNHARALNPNVTAAMFHVRPSLGESSVFQYDDSNSARAGINMSNEKLKGLKVAIIGLGGTGSYILDFLAKCPVAEIHLFDGDWMLQHNGFRAPSAISKATLERRIKKVNYYEEIYSNIHRGIHAHPYFMDNEHLDELDEFNFAFISADQGLFKKDLFLHLESKTISFIDVGMGIQKKNDALLGLLATTTSTKGMREHVHNGRVSFGNAVPNEYGSSNIQIVELNAMNAALAIIRWKKLYGFYVDQANEHFSVFSIGGNKIINDDSQPPIS